MGEYGDIGRSLGARNDVFDNVRAAAAVLAYS